MESLLSPLQVLLETYFSFAACIMLIFGLQENVDNSDQIH